eukprot:g9401.t1
MAAATLFSGARRKKEWDELVASQLVERCRCCRVFRQAENAPSAGDRAARDRWQGLFLTALSSQLTLGEGDEISCRPSSLEDALRAGRVKAVVVTERSLIGSREKAADFLDAESSLYHGGRFCVRLYLRENYPSSPPVAFFVRSAWRSPCGSSPSVSETLIPYHPNICFHTGDVCMDLLRDPNAWSPAMKLTQTLRAVLWSQELALAATGLARCRNKVKWFLFFIRQPLTTSVLDDPNDAHGLNSDAVLAYRFLLGNHYVQERLSLGVGKEMEKESL